MKFQNFFCLNIECCLKFHNLKNDFSYRENNNTNISIKQKKHFSDNKIKILFDIFYI